MLGSDLLGCHIIGPVYYTVFLVTGFLRWLADSDPFDSTVMFRLMKILRIVTVWIATMSPGE